MSNLNSKDHTVTTNTTTQFKLTPPQLALLKKSKGTFAENYKPGIKLKDLGLIDCKPGIKLREMAQKDCTDCQVVIDWTISAQGKKYLEAQGLA